MLIWSYGTPARISLIFIDRVRVAAGLGGYMRIVRPLQTTRRARTFAFVTSLLGAIGASQPSMAVTIGFGTSAGTVTPYVTHDRALRHLVVR